MQHRFLPARFYVARLGTLFLLAITPFALVGVAQAHESRPVGPYTFVVGFSSEPAYEGQMNGVQLRVRQGQDADAPPVEGLEVTLEVEVTHVPSGASQRMALRPVFGDPGHYRNNWIPTVPGQYRFRFFGMIEDREVDETFESGPDTFASVEPADTLYFPEDVPAARELEGAVRGAQFSADEALSLALDAEERLNSMRTLAMVAVVVAVVAILVAIITFVAARRRPAA